MANTYLNGRWQSVGKLQWAPTLTAHDPDPPITLEGAGETVIAPTSIASTEAFGNATVTTTLTISPSGIPSTAVFGSATVLTSQTITCTGIASTAAFGTADISQGGLIAPTGIPSGVSFGTATVSTTPAPVPVVDTTDCAIYGLRPTGSRGANGSIFLRGVSGRSSGLVSIGQSGSSGGQKRVGTAGGASCP